MEWAESRLQGALQRVSKERAHLRLATYRAPRAALLVARWAALFQAGGERLHSSGEGFPLAVVKAHSYNYELAAMYVVVLGYFTANGAGPLSVG